MLARLCLHSANPLRRASWMTNTDVTRTVQADTTITCRNWKTIHSVAIEIDLCNSPVLANHITTVELLHPGQRSATLLSQYLHLQYLISNHKLNCLLMRRLLPKRLASEAFASASAFTIDSYAVVVQSRLQAPSRSRR